MKPRVKALDMTAEQRKVGDDHAQQLLKKMQAEHSNK